MDLSTSLFVSVLFGSVGLGYFIYGKRQNRLLPLLAGVALCACPYFVSNLYGTLALGVLLIALPFLIRV